MSYTERRREVIGFQCPVNRTGRPTEGEEGRGGRGGGVDRLDFPRTASGLRLGSCKIQPGP